MTNRPRHDGGVPRLVAQSQLGVQDVYIIYGAGYRAGDP